MRLKKLFALTFVFEIRVFYYQNDTQGKIIINL